MKSTDRSVFHLVSLVVSAVIFGWFLHQVTTRRYSWADHDPRIQQLEKQVAQSRDELSYERHVRNTWATKAWQLDSELREVKEENLPGVKLGGEVGYTVGCVVRGLGQTDRCLKTLLGFRPIDDVIIRTIGLVSKPIWTAIEKK